MTPPHQAIDRSLRGTALERWGNVTMEAATKLGRPWNATKNYRRWMEEAGFVDIVERKFEWALGTWAKGKKEKMLGRLWRKDLLNGLDGMSKAVLTRGAGYSMEEIVVLNEGVRKDIADPNLHAYLPVTFIYGRKPV